MTRPLRLTAAGSLLVLALAGCGTVRTGAAAVIGNGSISTADLARTVATSLAIPGAGTLGNDRPTYQRSVLERLINARLVDIAAARRGTSVTPAAVDAQYAAIEQQVGGAAALPAQAAKEGLTLAQVHDIARTRALTSALGDLLTKDIQVPEATLQQAYQANIDQYDQVRTAQILLPDLAAAQALLPQATGLDNAGFAALAQSSSADASTKARGGDLGYAPLSAFEQNALGDYGKAAFAAKVGDTFAVASPKGGHVVRVLDRRTTTLEQATPALRRTVLQDQRNAAIQKALQDTAKKEHVTVNPRFGSWNVSQLSVGARSEPAGHVLSVPAGVDPNAPPADPNAPPAP